MPAPQSIAVLALAALAPALSAQTVLHVDADSGVDHPAGGGPGAPLKTISFATSLIDPLPTIPTTVSVAPGTYDAALGEVFPIEPPPGTRVIGAGVGQTFVEPGAGLFAFRFESDSESPFSDPPFPPSTLVERLTVRNGGGGFDVRSDGSSSFPTLRSLELVDLDKGIDLTSEDNGLADPVLSDARFASCGVGLETTSFYGIVDHAFADLAFEDCGTGVYVFFDTFGSTFEQELVLDRTAFDGCGVGVRSIGGTYDQHVVLRDTAIVNGGTAVDASPGIFTYGASLVRLERATVAGNQTGLVGDPSGEASFALDHTVLWNNGTPWVDLGPTPLADWSAHRSDLPHGWPGFADPTNVSVDPGFVDLAGGDFGLAPGSPLVDAGDFGPVGDALDLRLQPRHLDGDGDLIARIDLGAVEYDPVTLAVPASAGPGATIAVAVGTPPGWSALVGLAGDVAVLDLDPLGSLLLDPATLLLDAPGTYTLPALPVLSGATFWIQGLGWDPVSGWGAFSRRARLDVL